MRREGEEIKVERSGKRRGEKEMGESVRREGGRIEGE